MTLQAIKGFHHVAYRCKDAKETVEFYNGILGMDFQLAIAEDHVPSTGAYDPYMHIFLDAGNDNVLAFFELPEQPEMGRDDNTPIWVQHIAMRVEKHDAQMEMPRHIWKAKASTCSARPITAFSNPSISLTQMVTGWNLWPTSRLKSK